MNARQAFYARLRKREETFHRVTMGMSIDQLDEHEIFVPLSSQGYVSFPPGTLPFLVIDPPLPHLFVRGSYTRPLPKHRTGLFGMPSKMAAFAFSLPAGPPSHHGTCPASAYDIQDPLFICNGCYALGGNYQFAEYIISSQVVLAWVKRSLEDGTFVGTMIALLEDLWYYKTRAAQTDRNGTWFGSNCYFRLHDSGDFFSPSYFQAWCEIADAYPDTLFWAPTRMALQSDGSINRKWVRLFRQAPSNLIIRPSTLLFEEPAPLIEGLPAGSMCSVDQVQGTHTCPVYWYDDYETCHEARCRRCWTQPAVPVSYPTHGRSARAAYRGAGLTEKAARIHGPQVDPGIGAIVAPYPATGESWEDLGNEYILSDHDAYPY